MTYNSSSRNGATVRLVVIHTGEGILRALDMARFLDNNPGASAHATCDADTTIAPMVPYDRAAWTLGSGNPISDNIELCAFAGFTREQWLSTGDVISPKGTMVRNPRAILRRGAQWAAERCRARGIPIRKLTVEQVRADWAGICGHIDWNLAHNAGDHWDPGPGFPWDVFINDANGGDEVELTDSLANHFWDRKNLSVGDALANSYNNAADAAKVAARIEVKLDALANKLSDDEANILAAVRADSASVDMTDAQLQALLSGISDQTKAALKSALREGTDA